MSDTEDVLRDMAKSLGRINAKLESISAQLQAHRETRKDHEKRITSLEHGRARISGMAAVIGAAFAFLATYFKKKLGF